MKKLVLFLLAFAALPLYGQGVRIDPFPAATVAGSPLPGMQYPPILAIPGALVTLCNYPANGAPCTNYATTYTSAALTTTCPNSAQVTLQNSATCQNTADSTGSFGFWVAAGSNYAYELTVPGTSQTYGPYAFTAATAGCPVTGCAFVGPINVPKVNGVYYPLEYTGGDLCAQMTAAIAAMPSSGGTLDIEGLSSASPATCSSNPFASVTKPISVKIGPGKINTTAQWYVNSSFFHLRGSGMGNTQLIYTGTTALKAPDGTSPGGVLELDSPTPATTYNYGDSVSDMAIIGNTHSPYAMLVDGTHHSQFSNLGFWGAATCGYESKFAVVDDLQNLHSSVGDASFFGYPGSGPQNGICLDGEDAGHATTAATVTNPLLEGNSVCGITLTYASSMVISSGTSEENGSSGSPATTANICDQASNGTNTFIGIDLESEAGTSPTDLLLAGSDETFIGGLWADNAIISGNHNVIEGGLKASITVNAGASYNTLQNYRSNISGGTGITDGGTNTVVYGITDSSVGNPLRGMPWDYRETTIDPLGFGYGAMPQEDFLRGAFGFNATSETLLSNTVLISGKPWSAFLIGDWSTAQQFAAQTIPPFSVITSANPTVSLADGVVVTFSLNSSQQLQATCSAGCSGSPILAEFLGSIFVVQSQNAASSAYDMQLPTGLSAPVIKATTSIQAGAGAAITNTGNVPVTNATAPTGTCTPNGYIPVTVNGVTLHLATCP